MKAVTRWLLMCAVLISTLGLLQGQDPDLSGTWIGSTVVPNMEDRDNLTLVLKKEGSSYTGNITDTMGMLNATILEKVKLEKGTMTFEFIVITNGQELRVRATIKVSADKLTGSWESEQGDTGPLELVRKK